jgi:hypothetical protein
MQNKPRITIKPPNSRGLREISINGEVVGSAWSLHQLRRILRRFDYPHDINLETQESVCWQGGDIQTWPDHTIRRHITLALMMAGLLGSMALHINIGMPDALKGLTFAGRVTGSLFVLAGAVAGAASLAVLDYWGKRHLRLSGVAILLATLITLATTTLLLLLWLQEKEYTPYLLTYTPLFCWALWALGLLSREKTWKEIPHPKSFAAGATATVLLAGGNLVYSTMYQPAANPMIVSLEAKFGTPILDPEHSFIHLPLTLRARNQGRVPVYIIGDDYSVYGTSAQFSRSESGLKDLKQAMKEESDVSMYTEDSESKTISAGRFYSIGNWLESGEQYTAEKVISIPRDAKYYAIAAYFNLDVMRKDRGRIEGSELQYPHLSWSEEEGRFHCPPNECGESLIYHGRISHNNNIINVTRRPRYVTTWWSVTSEDSSVTPSISSFSFRRKDQLDEKESEREMDRYGVTSLYAEAITPFAALTDPSAGPQRTLKPLAQVMP